MNLTLNDFRLRTGRVTGMSTSEADDLALIDSWANEAIEQFLKDTKINAVTGSMAVTADQGDYTLDSDIIAFKDIWYTAASDPDHPYLLEEVGSSDLLNARFLQQAVGLSPRKYALEGAYLLMLYPAPESSLDTLEWIVVEKPTSVMAATADTPASTAMGNIPSGAHPILLNYVLWKAAEAEKHGPSQGGLTFKQAYEAGVMKYRADANRKSGVSKAGATWGRTRRRFPITPGTDIRS